MAESDDIVTVEGNAYFPREAVRAGRAPAVGPPHLLPVEGHRLLLRPRGRGRVNKDAVWYYPTPKDAAKEITGRVAFWHGVEVR